MKITNKFGLPQPFVDFIKNDKYNKGKADISVTSLIDSPKISLMRQKYNDQIEIDAVDQIWSIFGTSVHSILERSEDNIYSETEQRLYSEVDGWTLSGAIDRQEIDKKDGKITIVDYKVTSVWSVIYGKIEWERQLNCYAYLCENNYHRIFTEFSKQKKEVKQLNICAILRDWNRRDAEKKENYPQTPIVVVDIPLWSKEERESYIRDRINKHQDAQVNFDINDEMPLCSDEERWKKNDAWAVKKKGQKRALRVLDSEEEAIKYMDWHNETDKAYAKKTDLEMEFRQGEYNRCKGNYCSVAQFCQQYIGE